MESNGLGAKQVVGLYFFNILIKYHKINTKYYLLKLALWSDWKKYIFSFFLFSFENSYKFDHSWTVADRELLQNSGERETRSEGIGLDDSIGIFFILFTRNSFKKNYYSNVKYEDVRRCTNGVYRLLI